MFKTVLKLCWYANHCGLAALKGNASEYKQVQEMDHEKKKVLKNFTSAVFWYFKN